MSNQLLVAAVVIFVATTPTWIDCWQIWEHPEKYQDGITPRQVRAMIVIWYLLLLCIALSSWRMFA